MSRPARARGTLRLRRWCAEVRTHRTSWVRERWLGLVVVLAPADLPRPVIALSKCLKNRLQSDVQKGGDVCGAHLSRLDCIRLTERILEPGQGHSLSGCDGAGTGAGRAIAKLTTEPSPSGP